MRIHSPFTTIFKLLPPTMATSYVNGLTVAERRDKSSLHQLYSDKFRRGSPETIVTIDYGTTYCSVYYALYPKEEVVPLKLDQSGSHRVPNCLLFSNRGRLLKFGSEASESYADKDDEERKQVYYFEHVKKFFKHQDHSHDAKRRITALNEVTRATPVKDIGGSSFYLRDVIAHALHYLKTIVLDSLRKRMPRVKASDLDWVITVPAIWNAQGKQMMREAGYQAGLCSDGSPSSLKTTANAYSPRLIVDDSPDKLSLALEPEGAAIHCQKVIPTTRSLSGYVIVDAGGGTVDIACHEVNHASEIKELALTLEQSGNFCGGTSVNEEFQSFIGKMIGDPGFKIQEPDNADDKLEWQAEINRLVYRTFESKKVDFGHCNPADNYPILIPDILCEVYGEDHIIKKAEANGVQAEKKRRKVTLKLSSSKMASFFSAPVDETSKLLVSILRTHSAKIDRVYLVGGFGGCAYFKQQIQKKTKEMLRRDVDFQSPPQPELAVARGATAFRNDPTVIRARKANATYGIGLSTPYDYSKHSDCGSRKDYDSERQTYYCNNVLKPFVLKGDTVRNNEVFLTSGISARTSSSTSATFPIYSTLKTNAKYTDTPEVTKLGSVTVQMGGSGLNRALEVAFDITHTEIQVLAFDKTSGNVNKTVVDFLSN